MHSFHRCIFLRHQLILRLTFLISLISWLSNISVELPKFSSDIKLCQVSASETYRYFFKSHLAFVVVDLSVETVGINCEVCTLWTSLQEVVKAVCCGKKVYPVGWVFRKCQCHTDFAIMCFSNFEQVTLFFWASDFSCKIRDWTRSCKVSSSSKMKTHYCLQYLCCVSTVSFKNSDHDLLWTVVCD